MTSPDDVEPMPDDERSITVVHSPQARFRRAILVMFVVLGVLIFAGYREVKQADGRAETAVAQNDRLQMTLDELSGTLARLEEAERLDDEEARLRSERTIAFIAAVLANSSDPVIREAARQALADLGADVPSLSPSGQAEPGPEEPPAAAPGPPPPSQPGAEEPPPAPPPPSEEPPGPLDPVQDAVDDVEDTLCGALPVC